MHRGFFPLREPWLMTSRTPEARPDRRMDLRGPQADELMWVRRRRWYPRARARIPPSEAPDDPTLPSLRLEAPHVG